MLIINNYQIFYEVYLMCATVEVGRSQSQFALFFISSRKIAGIFQYFLLIYNLI
jgi:hypothetical protein